LPIARKPDVTRLRGTQAFGALSIVMTDSGGKKTFRYSNVHFYNHLYRSSVFRNLFLKSGIIGLGRLSA
jgi:hypothetical protein